MADFSERFWERVEKTDGCWIWRGSISSAGYGQVTNVGRNLRAHRVAYELVVGPIPKGMHLDHLCRERRCVNPAHLEPVDCRTNVLRGVGPTAIRATQEACTKGHPLEWRGRAGGRVSRWCRICNNDAQRERRQPISHPKTCQECGTPFESKRKDATYCSPSCRYRAKDRGRVRGYDPARRREKYEATGR